VFKCRVYSVLGSAQKSAARCLVWGYETQTQVQTQTQSQEQDHDQTQSQRQTHMDRWRVLCFGFVLWSQAGAVMKPKPKPNETKP